MEKTHKEHIIKGWMLLFKPRRSVIRRWTMIMNVTIALFPVKILQNGGIITHSIRAVIPPPKGIATFADMVFLLLAPNSATSVTFDREIFVPGDISVEHVSMKPYMKVK